MRIFTLVLIFVFMLPAWAQRSDFAEIDFGKADLLAREHKGEDLKAIPILVHKLTSSLDTDVEKFRAFYMWVSQNIRGDYHLMVENNSMRKKYQNDSIALVNWNQGFKKEVFKILRRKKRTLCSGYTYLIKEMANLAGIECEIIDGYGPINKLKLEKLKVPNHSWNAVKLEGKWYLCDSTWAAGYTDLETYLFKFDYDDQYFLMAPEEFAKTHMPVDTSWLLLDMTSRE